ncbi:MAG: glycine--tRNA ligase subunit beta [Firmicutes bacterium]|nr:glycine--tRNA ligase subunit beta [Bacillota bacterium]
MPDVRDLLLEIGCEEIPARFMPGGLKGLRETAERLFRDNRLAYHEVLAYGTPRRLVLFVKGLAERQSQQEEKIKGPSKDAAFDQDGNPTKAALGFAGRLGLKVEELKIEKAGKKEYLVALRSIAGKKTADVLSTLLPDLLKGLSFPKNMFWEKSRIRFPRPIRWILCLYGSEMISFSYGGLQSGRETRGHRFLAPATVNVLDPEHYFACMEESAVVLDQDKRKKLIEEEVKSAAAAYKLEAFIDPSLLEEVNYLVEKPEALFCSFPEKYLELPREVLVTTMQHHQRYFPVEDSEGRLSPHFIAVSNNGAAQPATVRGGNERVLKARLADAQFFYEDDLKTPLEKQVIKLKSILFQEELGTVYEKAERLVTLTEYIGNRLDGLDKANKEAALRAAYLAKADLVTNMVGEFPELQGIMGREYALKSGEREDVAQAIYEHYLPRFAGDRLPVTEAGALLALADKVDHLAGCFALGIRPTGSQDPYALRRQSLGLLQILLEHGFHLPLTELIRHALELYRKRVTLQEMDLEDLTAQIRDFILQRLRYLFQERGMDYDLVEAVLGSSLDEIAPLWNRVNFLQANRESEHLMQAAAAYTRAANLARQAPAGEPVDEKLFLEEVEKKLFGCYTAAKEKIERAVEEDNFGQVLAELAGLKTPLDLFFDQVLVMVDDNRIRLNRLALLQQIKELFQLLADFSKIVFSTQN